jgi:Rrf2 family transcriptional regulator, iron-sulfur cluster assembly transcription factor
MLPLSLTVGHAIRLLRCLDEPGGQRIQVESVAEYTGISKAYLSKIVHRLGRKGFVDSQRGHHGGVVLARPLRSITLGDISVAVDGTERRTRCLLGLEGCTEETPCVLHAYWQKTRQEVFDQLGQVTLEDMNRHHDPGVERCIALRTRRTRPSRPGMPYQL